MSYSLLHQNYGFMFPFLFPVQEKWPLIFGDTEINSYYNKMYVVNYFFYLTNFSIILINKIKASAMLFISMSILTFVCYYLSSKITTF